MKNLNIHSYTFKFIIIQLTLFSLIGCQKEVVDNQGVVARVSNRTLTQSELSAWEASLRGKEVPQEARSAYIRRWVEEEIIYKEAVNRGYDDDPWVIERIDELTRTVMTARLLDEEYAKIPQPSASAIQEFFFQHSSEFVWPHTHLVVEYWRADDRQGMNILRSNVQRGRQTDLWSGLPGNLENGRIALNGEGSADPDVWKLVSRMKVGQVSQVINLNGTNWVFKLIDRREEGEAQGLEDVEDDIISMLAEEERQDKKDELIRSLMDKYRREGDLQWSMQPTVSVADTDTSIK